MKKNIVASLDIGTTKTCALIAERESDGTLRILGSGIAKSEGMIYGSVANVLKMHEAIKSSIKEAEAQSGLKISKVNVGVAGIYINSMRYRNWVTINNPDGLITREDVDKLFDEVRKIRVPSDYFILHIIPEKYIIDDSNIVYTLPIGIAARKVEAWHHIVLANIASTENLKKAISMAGLEINSLILQPLASANAVLERDEKELGVVLIDIGGGTTDLAVYVNGSIRHTRVIGIAGNHITNDIKSFFNLIAEQSEKLKIEHGYATTKALLRDETIYVRSLGARPPVQITLSVLAHVIQLRMTQLFNFVNNELVRSNLKSEIHGGIVITGGGALLRGITELASDILEMQARIGIPTNITGQNSNDISNPIFSTAIGLLYDGVPSIIDTPEKDKPYFKNSIKTQVKKLLNFLKNL